MNTDGYSSPLSERYASKEMQHIFSPDMKFSTWRKLWIALAETEMELGLKNEKGEPEYRSQIDEIEGAYLMTSTMMLRRNGKNRYAMMLCPMCTHYGKQCPKAKGIIHLGATSCYVGDNTDIIIMTEALLSGAQKTGQCHCGTCKIRGSV